MEKHLTEKMNHITPGIIAVIILILMATIMLRNRETGTFKESENFIQTNEPRSEAKANNYSVNNKRQPKDDEWYREKILEFVSQLKDTTALMDYSQRKVQKITGKTYTKRTSETPATLYNPAIGDITHDQLRSAVASYYEPFVKKTGISPDTKEKLIDLIVYKKLDTGDVISGWGYSSSGKVTREEIQKEVNEIVLEYDEHISELLTEEEFTEYKEYEQNETQNFEQRKELINNFMNIVTNTNMSVSEQQEILEYLMNAAKGVLTESEIDKLVRILADDDFMVEALADASDKVNADEQE